MRNRAILAFIIVTSLARIHPDTRTEGVDFVIIVDTSLSMASTIDEAKRYAAGELVGRLVETGDWLCVVKFYEKSEIVWSGDIRADADIAQAVRSLNLLKADGRFTDIGAALDKVDRLLVERGHPERPKYVVLVTDERQEAPKGTAYYSEDYTVVHPALEYVKKIDLGGFRAITIGYGLAAKVEGGTRSLLTTLSSPPETSPRPLAGSAGEANAAGSAASATGNASLSGGAAMGSAAGGGAPAWAWIVAAIAAALGLGALLLIARRRRAAKDGNEARSEADKDETDPQRNGKAPVNGP